MTLHSTAAPGSKENPFPSLREAQARGFSYFATEQETGMIIVRMTVYRGGLHFMLGFALPDKAEGAEL